MSAICVQGIPKPVATVFKDWAYNSLGLLNDISLGASTSGLYFLNLDSTSVNKKVIEFAKTDFGVPNHKKLRYMYIGLKSNGPINIHFRVDDLHEFDIEVPSTEMVLSRIRRPVSRDLFGTYWEISLEAECYFVLDFINFRLGTRIEGFGDS
jgi:hypothetical protein